MLKLILGEASSGKSHRICREVVEQSVREPDKKFIVIVPEQASLSMQKKIIENHPQKATMNIHVASFNYLAHQVFSELKKDKTDVLDDTGKALVLRKILDDLRDDLVVYKNKVRMPGFTEEVKSVITELKQYGVDDNMLYLMQNAAVQKGNKKLFSKLSDIRLILEKFDEEIEDKFTTSEEVLDIFARIIPESSFLKGAEFFMDGFTGFTPVQYRIIEKLLEVSENVTITITVPDEKINPGFNEHDLFSLSNQTYFKLTDMAERLAGKGVFPEGESFSKTVQLKNTEDTKENKTVQAFSAQTINDEVVFTAKKILRYVKRENLRFRDIAVVTSDMETYYTPVKDIFEEAEIPYFVDYKAELSDNPLARFVMAALEIVNDRMSVESVFTFLKLGLLNIPLNEISKLENYCLEFGIKGPKAWKNEFKKQRTLKRNPEGEDEVFWNLEEINAVKNTFSESMVEFYDKLKRGEKPAYIYVNAVKALLEKNNIEEQIKEKAQIFSDTEELSRGKEYEQIYKLVTELLDKIAAIMGEEAISVKEFENVFSSGVEEIKIGIAPPALDGVVVGDITRTRLGDVKVLFLLGVNDGKIPMVSSGNGILTQKERELLKEENFEIAPTVLENIYTQRFYIYLLLNRPEKALYLTYALMNQEGKELERSYVFDELDELLPGSQLIEAEEEKEETWKFQGLRELAAKIENPDQKILSYFAKEDPESLKQILAGAFFTNREAKLDREVAEKLYGEILKGSVSRFEKFNECPFKHFLQYGLKISKRLEYEVEATDIGTLYHESLKKYSLKLEENGFTFRNVTDEESDRIVKESVDEAAQETESDVLESTARNEFMMQRIERVTKVTADTLRDHIINGKYEPKYFEFPFKTKVADSALFRGIIDRVDVYDGEDVYVKIIDYKSGNKVFDVKDVYTGTGLQLVAYLDAALKEVSEKYPERTIKPGGIYYYVINDSFVKDDEEAKNKFRMRGLTNCDEEALNAIDVTAKENKKSSIVPIGYKNDGSLNSNSKVAGDEEFKNLVNFVDNIIKEDINQVKDGNTEIKPLYQNKTKNACTYCDYKSICKFEPGQFGEDWNTLTDDLSKDTIEAEIFGKTETVKTEEETHDQ